jgi:hypothetical protein
MVDTNDGLIQLRPVHVEHIALDSLPHLLKRSQPQLSGAAP